MGGGGGALDVCNTINLALRGSVDLTIMDLVANRHLNGQAPQSFNPSMGFSCQPVILTLEKDTLINTFLYVYYSIS